MWLRRRGHPPSECLARHLPRIPSRKDARIKVAISKMGKRWERPTNACNEYAGEQKREGDRQARPRKDDRKSLTRPTLDAPLWYGNGRIPTIHESLRHFPHAGKFPDRMCGDGGSHPGAGWETPGFNRGYYSPWENWALELRAGCLITDGRICHEAASVGWENERRGHDGETPTEPGTDVYKIELRSF